MWVLSTSQDHLLWAIGLLLGSPSWPKTPNQKSLASSLIRALHQQNKPPKANLVPEAPHRPTTSDLDPPLGTQSLLYTWRLGHFP